MIRIIRVEGESMSPEYNDGDYVLISRLPLLLRRIKVSDVLVFNSKKYGVLIKKVSQIDTFHRIIFFAGLNKKSLTTEQIGAVEKKDIIGSVLLHFKKQTCKN